MLKETKELTQAPERPIVPQPPPPRQILRSPQRQSERLGGWRVTLW